MPKYTYRGDEGRTYNDPKMPAEARAPEVGESYDLKEPPDHRWTETKSGKKEAPAKPAAPDEESA